MADKPIYQPPGSKARETFPSATPRSAVPKEETGLAPTAKESADLADEGIALLKESDGERKKIAWGALFFAVVCAGLFVWNVCCLILGTPTLPAAAVGLSLLVATAFFLKAAERLVTPLVVVKEIDIVKAEKRRPSGEKESLELVREVMALVAEAQKTITDK